MRTINIPQYSDTQNFHARLFSAVPVLGRKSASGEKLINVFLNENQISAGPTGIPVRTEKEVH